MVIDQHTWTVDVLEDMERYFRQNDLKVAEQKVAVARMAIAEVLRDREQRPRYSRYRGPASDIL